MIESWNPEPARLRVMIVDDEQACRARLSRLLKRFSDVDIVAEAVDGAEAVRKANASSPDLIFLDIQMPERDGIEVAAELSQAGGPAIVFVTGFDTYALRAFEIQAVDYLMKPVDQTRLGAALDRVRAARNPRTVAPWTPPDLARLEVIVAELRRNGGSGHDSRYQKRLLVSDDERSLIVAVSDIDWIEAAGNYVRLHVGATKLPLRQPLNALEESLDPNQFIRIHRCALVNLDKIKETQAWFSGSAIVILANGQRLRLSRSYRNSFTDMFRPRKVAPG